MWWLYIILFVFGYFIFKELSGNDDSPQPSNDRYRRRKTGRNASNHSADREKESFVQSAQRQESMGNYDEASRLYLRAGQVFSAAKMKAMQGPQHAQQAVELMQVNSPERSELITRNLANDFFYRLEKPAIASALLRGLGLEGEAQAVEVAAGLSVNQSYESPMQTSSSVDTTEAEKSNGEMEFNEDLSLDTASEFEMNVDDSMDVGDEVSEELGRSSSKNYPNSMMMASTTLESTCSVCKRDIKSGDSFIYCLNCGEPGHYSHLGEMIKVTGKCPKCKQRLTPTMYEI